MNLKPEIKLALAKRFEKVKKTPASFAFFVAIHDFIECIEITPALSKKIAYREKADLEVNVPAKYDYLRQIYQGLEDADKKTTADIGHTRYTAVRDLDRIHNKEQSENNFFWKKRDVFRKVAGELYERLTAEAVVE